jgi:purine-binding chemotaxis protein CheW
MAKTREGGRGKAGRKTPEAGGPISLPSSGLASDILARADAALVESAEPGALMTPEAEEVTLPETAASRVHNISFFAAPARDEKKAVEATEHLVTFFLSDEEYGIDVRLVQEIIRVTEVTQVPRAPEFIKGVINLRGRIIPVIDLKRKLGLGEVAIATKTRVVVVRLRDRLVGLLVDGASQVLKVPVSTIEAAPDEVVEIDANYIRGVAKLVERLIILVDLPKILGADLRESQSALPAGAE